MKLYTTMLMAIIVSYSYAQTVKIDSAYTYFSQDPNCNTYLVSKHRIANDCFFVDKLIEINDDSVNVRLCYSMGQATITCPRRDTFCIGNLAPGFYNMKVVVFVNFGGTCDDMYRGDSVYRTFSILPTSIDDVYHHYFSINPNPATSQLNCEVLNPKGYYSIYSITGSQLIQPTAIPATNFNIDVSMLLGGIYYMAIQDDKQRYVKKFVKQ